MSAYSGRAVYLPSSERATYSLGSNRALYAGPAPINPAAQSAWFYGSASYAGSTGWTQANYEAAQDSARSALKADTSLTTSSSTAAPIRVDANCRRYYSERSQSEHYAARYGFTLPANMRGAITKLALFGYVGAARFWDLTEYYIYTAYDYASWDDFGATLKIFFSTSSSAYTTGDALYSGTADASITFEDINDAHTARSLSPVVGAAAANNNYLFPRMLLSCNAAIEKVNDFSSDTIYVWFAITRPNYMPFLYSDPGTGIDSDFNCVASLLDPKLLVSKA